jgi:hypothetical protein
VDCYYTQQVITRTKELVVNYEAMHPYLDWNLNVMSSQDRENTRVHGSCELMARSRRQMSRPKSITVISLAMILIGATYAGMAAIFIANQDLALNYLAPMLDDLEEVSSNELLITVLGTEISVAILGAIGIILGLAILRGRNWARVGSMIYNGFMVLSSISAFASNDVVPDSYLAIVSLILLVLLFRGETKEYFQESRILNQ